MSDEQYSSDELPADWPEGIVAAQQQGVRLLARRRDDARPRRTPGTRARGAHGLRRRAARHLQRHAIRVPAPPAPTRRKPMDRPALRIQRLRRPAPPQPGPATTSVASRTKRAIGASGRTRRCGWRARSGARGRRSARPPGSARRARPARATTRCRGRSREAGVEPGFGAGEVDRARRTGFSNCQERPSCPCRSAAGFVKGGARAQVVLRAA